MGVRAAIINAALAEIQKQQGVPGPEGPISQRPGKTFMEDGRYVRGGYKRLQQIFASAYEGAIANTDPAFKESQKSGAWPGGQSWCGIFATSVWRTAGVFAKWKSAVGPVGGGVTKIEFWNFGDISGIAVGSRTAENTWLEPGDMGVIAKNAHHFIIVGISSDRKLLHTVEGNTDYQELSERRDRKVSDLVAMFKVTSETRFPSKVFSRPSALPAATFTALAGKWSVDTGSGTSWYYSIGKDKSVSWAYEPDGKDGSGKLLSAGGGMLKLAWQDGTVDLWDVSSVSSGAASGFYYWGGSTVKLTATKI
jgi:hypothetical protein